MPENVREPKMEEDCIVISPVFYNDEICAFIRSKTGIPIVSMDKLIGKRESLKMGW